MSVFGGDKPQAMMAAALQQVANRKHVASTRTYPTYRDLPIRTLGESEARMIPGDRYVGDDIAVRIAPISWMMLEKNADFDGNSNGLMNAVNAGTVQSNQVLQSLAARDHGLQSDSPQSLDDTEYRMRQVMLATKFTIEHDWYAVLEPRVGVVKDEEVALPYEVMFIRLGYQQMSAIVTQSQETHEITVTNFQGDMYSELNADTEAMALFKQHVLCALVAMELGLTKTEPASLVDMGLATTRTGIRTDVFKVLAIRPSQGPGDHNINTGRKGQRWHLRRSHWKLVKGERRRIKWYAAGNIELGMVIKDYVLDDLR